MILIDRPTAVVKSIVAMLVVAWVGSVSGHAATVATTTTVNPGSNLGVIKGIVRDDGGNPIADATVAIFRAGTSKVLKQVRSAADGSFLARILPGTYTIFAVAQGFNPITLADVQINSASQLTYGFKLERAGGGNTLPEKRLDKNNPKWVIRSAQTSRSIYQNTQGSAPSVEDRVTLEETAAGVADREDSGRQGQSVAETYFAASEHGNYAGVNFATLLPVSDEADVVLAAQAGVGRNAPQRFEVQTKFRPTDSHQVRLTSSIGTVGSFVSDGQEKSLGQFSIQASDEWKVREGVIVVLGVDYARFIGGGDDSSISPRFGLQFDLGSKTRFRSAFTSHTEERTWSSAIALEDSQVIFRDPVSIDDFVVESGKPILNKSNRLEFGIERVLDNNSSIEANAFFDTTLSRGVGMTGFAFDAPGAVAELTEFVGNQQGEARGFRLVYSRRLSGRLSTAAGYSIGTGQKLSEEGITNPADLFETAMFQTFFGQFEADLKTGTNIKTIFRLSPQATVFAIDPFQGRLAIYDPSLSILVTQSLPTLGLPFQAQAVLDARNLFDFQSGVYGEEGSLRLNAHRRALRGSILVRF
jgi:hypothetical protein